MLGSFDYPLSNLYFQKLLFLYCQESNNPSPYEFVPYRLGAFSFTSYAGRWKLTDHGLLVDERLTWRCLERGTGCISCQVVQQALNVDAKKAGLRGGRFPHPPDRRPCATMDGLYERGLELRVQYGSGFYDSMIIAGAIESGCTRLCGEDLQHGE